MSNSRCLPGRAGGSPAYASPLESLRKLADEIDQQLEVAYHRCDQHGFLPKEHWDAVNAVFGAAMLARVDAALAKAKKRFRPFALVD